MAGSGAGSSRQEDIIMNASKLSRRRLLSAVPAVAAIGVPAAATALTGLPVAIPAHVDPRELERHLELLAMLDGMPSEKARQVLTAITEAIECSMRTTAHDAD